MDRDTWTITHEPTAERPDRHVIRLNGDAVDVVNDEYSAETLTATRAELRSEWLDDRPYVIVGKRRPPVLGVLIILALVMLAVFATIAVAMSA